MLKLSISPSIAFSFISFYSKATYFCILLKRDYSSISLVSITVKDHLESRSDYPSNHTTVLNLPFLHLLSPMSVLYLQKM
jgi:hypothetical protein